MDCLPWVNHRTENSRLKPRNETKGKGSNNSVKLRRHAASLETGRIGHLNMSTLTLEESDSWQSYEASLSSSQKYRKRRVPVQRSLETSARYSFSALQPQKRKSNDLSELTVDKLRFDSLRLYGRDKEIAILNEELESLVSSSNRKRRVVLISGTSGAGKTKLAETLRFPTFQKKGLFVKGKFDLNLRSQPYSGISNACAEICGSILELQLLQPTRASDICKEIEETLADELVLLIQAIPILVEIVHRPDPAMEQRQSKSSEASSCNKSKNRIQYAFVRFMRLVAKYFPPLVLVLDDLQWADASSLDLLDCLIADRQNPKLMVIGMYRSNEVDETHIFYRFLEEQKEKRHEQDFSLTQLRIDNLDIHAVNDIVQDLMQCEDSRTIDLAEICVKKTHGNPFFLLHFIHMLYEHKLLLFNYATISWSWNVEAIAMSTRACDNVADLLQNQMKMLPMHLLELLKLASCLGSTFDQYHIQRVWRKFMNDTPEQDCDKLITNALDELGEAGLIVKVSQTPLRFSWVHVKIQEAAADLIPELERDTFSRTIGQILLSELGVDELESLIFVVVDLLNSPPIDDWDPEKRLELSALNLTASQKAIKVSSFESAAKYAGKGITLLLDNAWDVDTYQLTLQLYSVGAKAEGFLGNVETMETYCRAVIWRKDVPLKDKLDVYSTWVEGIANRSQMEEAASLTFQILDKFNCRFSNNTAILKAGIIGNVLRIKTTMKSRSPSKLSPMNDETMVQMMRLLDQLCTYLYTLNDDRMPLIVFRSLNLTIKHGVCVYSPPAFATTGIMLTGILDDIQGGTTYGQHALSLSEETKSTLTHARTMFIVYSFLFPWTRPIREVLNPLLQAYDLGLQTG